MGKKGAGLIVSYCRPPLTFFHVILGIGTGKLYFIVVKL